MLPALDFTAHRQSLLDAMEEDEALLLFGGGPKLRNGDADYRYRPNSDVYWVSGWEEPTVAVFLRPGEAPFTLFVQPRDPEKEQWDGRRHGPEGAIARFGADAAFPIDALPEELTRLLQGVSRLHYGFAEDPDNDALLMGCIRKAAKAARRNGLSAPETFHHPSVLLHEKRLLKNEAELAHLREAARITAEAHTAAMRATRPGVSENAIEAVLLDHFHRSGSTGVGYVPIVAGGDNANILHYQRNRDRLEDGDVLLVDAGCEVSYYTSDVTRTWPVNGTFSEAQRRVYGWVLKAQLEAIDACRAGRSFDDVHLASKRVLIQGMVDLGLLEGPWEKRFASGSEFKRWYPHGTSHWLGLDVHDVGSYGRGGEVRTLQPGMVLTVEPGLYIPRDAEDAPEALRGIGVRIEDDVLVTDGDPEVLTAAVPKAIEAVEAACRG